MTSTNLQIVKRLPTWSIVARTFIPFRGDSILVSQTIRKDGTSMSNTWSFERRRISGMRVRYDLTVKQAKHVIQKQDNNGKCDICQKHGRKLNVDHEHKTGKVRGLVCNPCNTVLGNIEKYGTKPFQNYLENPPGVIPW